jgi:pimeloyl-ACP methyl ester carboxylesterase
MDIWEDFAKALEGEFLVITVDLPGHGQTGIFGPTHSMEFMAGIVKAVLTLLDVSSCVMIGHSMGGYVTLAFAEKYPGLLKGIGLFHSHAAADSEEARKNRVRTINIVYSNRSSFIQQFVPELFAPENAPLFSDEIEKLKQRALLPQAEGITAAIRGMMERADHTPLLRETRLPVLFIAGKSDPRIPLDLIFSQASLVSHAEILILGRAGHMGFIEERDITLQTIRYFTKKVFELNS